MTSGARRGSREAEQHPAAEGADMLHRCTSFVRCAIGTAAAMTNRNERQSERSTTTGKARSQGRRTRRRHVVIRCITTMTEHGKVIDSHGAEIHGDRRDDGNRDERKAGRTELVTSIKSTAPGRDPGVSTAYCGARGSTYGKSSGGGGSVLLESSLFLRACASIRGGVSRSETFRP